MKTTLHERWLMCRPTFYDVTYEINPWMSIKRKPVHSRAQDQWETVHSKVKSFAPKLDLIDPINGLPDMVFTANGALVRGKKAVVSKFKFQERQGESPYYENWFKDQGYEVYLSKDCFEGEGDALFAGDVLFGGFGFRSGKEVYEAVGDFLTPKELVFCEMIDPRFYHLDTCFAPLNDNQAVVFPGAFTPATMREMEKRLELILVKEEEAVFFACNQIVMGENIILPAGCPRLCESLEAKGFKTHSVELDEFIKAGGAAKCVILKI